MIRFFEEKDKEAVISLWQEAFGDKREEIAVFVDFFKSGLLVFENDGQVVSMLTLIKTSVGAKKGRYVYAVATDKKFRGMGFASRLIDFAKQYISDNDEIFLVLVPREKSLFNFYKKHGFCELCCCEKIEKKINIYENIDVKAETITAEDYFSFRESFFAGEKHAVWDIKMLDFIKKAYRGDFIALRKENRVCGTAFCYVAGDVLVVSELLQRGNPDTSINALGKFFRLSKVFCIIAKNQGDKFAMIYPEEFRDTYFGLAMK
ncbi:MAG: GNAT family N-acetyltransferase [Firmicutes bacterium]|nr:GNAT family N-acetyltransferase [Bacillota bacterium]